MAVMLPFNYTPRKYQLPFLQAMDGGKRRACKAWHRRSGKDKTDFNFTIKEMAKRVGIYYYSFPELNQGRKALWDAVDRNGFRLLDHFPRGFIEGEPNNTEMKVRTVNGSLFQVIGGDRFNAVMEPTQLAWRLASTRSNPQPPGDISGLSWPKTAGGPYLTLPRAAKTMRMIYLSWPRKTPRNGFVKSWECPTPTLFRRLF